MAKKSKYFSIPALEGLSGRKVAELAGCSYQTVYNWAEGNPSYFEDPIKKAIEELKKEKAE